MSPLAIITGYAFLLISGVAVARLSWPPIRDAIRATHQEISAFVHSLPDRFEMVARGWRGTPKERIRFTVVFLIAAGALIWDIAFTSEIGPDFTTLIGLFVTIAGLYLLIEGGGLIGFWVELFLREPNTGTEILNPLNRTGVAEPLGEARFAKEWEVHDALGGGRRDAPAPLFED